MLIGPFVYLGAKHMVTGYDHLLFLFGVIFFLYRLKDVSIYVAMFAVGHSTTLLLGVLANISVSSYLVDAIIGLSVVHKALDNMGAYQRWFGVQPNTKAATLIFGLFTASAWPPSSRTSSSRATGCSPTSWLSMWASRSAKSWRWARS